jgi:hypothetical protein
MLSLLVSDLPKGDDCIRLPASSLLIKKQVFDERSNTKPQRNNQQDRY